MSKSAVLFLLLAITCFTSAWLVPTPGNSLFGLLVAGGGLWTVLLLAALFVGRRIKFDPLLR
jgi:hypothetical protein